MCQTEPWESYPKGWAQTHADAPPLVSGEPIEIDPGVYVIADRRIPLVPNIGIAVGTRAALVIDTGLGPRNGARVLDEARRLAPDRQLYLTTTHFHPDHSLGAQVFKETATIVCNDTQRDEALRKGPAYVAVAKSIGPAVAAELDAVELVDPDLTYHGSADLDLGGKRVTLRSVGPAHTAGDQIVLIDDRVLFTGDLVQHHMFPFVPYSATFDVDSDVTRWIGLLDELLNLNAAVVVPGHGDIAKNSIVAYRDYFDFIRSETTGVSRRTTPRTETIEAIVGAVRKRWTDWDYPDRIGFAADAFYRAGLAP